MGELVELVRAGRDAHAAARQVARREGDPGGDDVRRAEPPIRRILVPGDVARRSEEHTSELQSLMRISYAVFCLKKKKKQKKLQTRPLTSSTQQVLHINNNTT